MLQEKSSNYTQSYWTIALLNAQVGIWMGFLAITNQQLRALQISYKEQALLSTVVWTASFKILFAPFLDSYFIKRLGKCKTYILLGALVNIILLILLYDRIDDLIEQKDITTLWYYLFPLTFSVFIQHIGMMAWVLTIFSKENLTAGSAAINAGQTVGYFFSFFIFAILSSTQSLNKWFYTENPIDKPFMNRKQFIFTLISYTIVLNGYIMLFVPEKKDDEIKENPNSTVSKSPLVVIKESYKFVMKPEVLTYIKVILAINFMTRFVDGPFTMKFQDLGYPQDFFQTLYLIGMAIEMFKIYFATYFTDMKKLLTYRYYFWLMFVVACVMNNLLSYYYCLYTKDYTTVFWIWTIVGFKGLFDHSFNVHLSIACSLAKKEKNNAGTNQTALGSICNFTGSVATSISIYLMSYVEYDVI